MALIDILPTGRENALSTDMLVMLGGYGSSRELQQDIRTLRLKGIPVISVSEAPGGYYLSNDENEILRCSQTLENRARETRRAAEALKNYKKE